MTINKTQLLLNRIMLILIIILALAASYYNSLYRLEKEKCQLQLSGEKTFYE